MPLLFCRIVQHAKEAGLGELDLGRSDIDNTGLIAFKDHLGAHRTALRYYRFGEQANAAGRRLATRLVKRIWSVVPPGLQVSVSGRLYRHFA
jgi:hypothetical protein